jgi:hypothetical protein
MKKRRKKSGQGYSAAPWGADSRSGTLVFECEALILDILIDKLDGALMLAYRHLRGNARRMARLTAVLLPLVALLVGSCKTSELPGAYGGDAGPAQFRMALFPDRVNFKAGVYSPAAGYVSRARAFVAGAPEALELLTETEIGYLFGSPAMERQDADARIWQYKTGACVVDFYFYGGRESPVSYVDVRLKDGGMSGRRQEKCLRRLMEDDASA